MANTTERTTERMERMERMEHHDPTSSQANAWGMPALSADTEERELLGLLIEDSAVAAQDAVYAAGYLELAAGLHLAPEHVASPVGRAILRALYAIAEEGRHPDLWSLYLRLRESDATYSIEHLQRFSTATGLPNPEQGRERVRELAARVIEAARRRELMDLAKTLAALAGAPEATTTDLMERARRRLDRLEHAAASGAGGDGSIVSAVASYREQVGAWRKEPFALRGTTTGLRCLDDMTHGIRRGDLWVLAARMSAGKTAMMLHHILAAARAAAPGHTVGIFSLEMSRERLVHRLVSMLSGQDGDAIEQGAPHVDWRKVDQATRDLDTLPIRILDAHTAASRVNGDAGVVTPETIARIARQWHQAGPLDLVGVDYMELVNPPEDMARENYDLRLSEIARRLKRLASELDVPLLLLAQLNRDMAKSASKIPTLEGLRYSDGPAMHADVVVFPIVWDYWRVRGQEDALPDEVKALPRGVTDFMVAKHRHGKVGKVRGYFHAPTQRYLDYDEDRRFALTYDGQMVAVE